MAARVCPMCGLKNPGSAGRCDCGHVFEHRSSSKEPVACPQCTREWPPHTPLCACGHWFDEDARDACVVYRARRDRAATSIVLGAIIAFGGGIALPGAIIWIAGGISLIVAGGRSMTFALAGLRSFERPVHELPRAVTRSSK